MNNSDPAISLPEDQSRLAQNVEYVESEIGDRRLGSAAIDLTGAAALAASDRVSFLFRDLPTDDETAARLWALGVTGTSSSTLVYKDTTWHTPTLKDAITITGKYANQLRAQSLHGKTFLAYKSGQDRLHVFDGATVRRAGLAQPGAPSLAATGAGGTYATIRYARVRVIEKSGSTILRRSEPSNSASFTPDGTKSGMVVTQGTVPGEGETHWEVELSTDGANFYVAQTVAIGTTTATDTTAFATGYSAFTLSENIGAYTLIGSVRYMVVDGDRLVWASSFESATLSSRLGYTPVNGDPGVGNDERFDSTVSPFKDLDASEGGGVTGLSNPINGSFYVFKLGQIHKAVRSGSRQAAYDTLPETKKSGAIEGSVVDGFDQNGDPCAYFIDPKVGPRRFGQTGLKDCGWDLRNTWKSLNIDATQAVATGVYYATKHQVHWWIATGANNVPDTHIVLHTRMTRDQEDGVRRGWVIWTGLTAAAQTACLFASNIDAGAARSLTLVPFVGLAGNGLIHRCDTGINDNGTAYTARVVSRPHSATGSVLQKFGAMAGAIVAKATSGAKVCIKLIRDRGLETNPVDNISLAPTASEEDVIVLVDDLRMSEARLIEIEIADAGTPGTAQWQVQQVVLKERQEQSA